MSNDRERLARQWAEEAKDFPNAEYSVKTNAAIEHILATTTPPAMDEVEWDEEKHALTGAVVDVGGGPVDVVMLAGSVDGIDYATLDGKFGYEPRFYFTPNGKRYELREVGAGESEADEKPEHPETLVTAQDYENAPEGTVVQIGGVVALRVNGYWLQSCGRGLAFSCEMAQLGRGTVFSWGRDA